jgi:hypothetical protein
MILFILKEKINCDTSFKDESSEMERSGESGRLATALERIEKLENELEEKNCRIQELLFAKNDLINENLKEILTDKTNRSINELSSMNRDSVGPGRDLSLSSGFLVKTEETSFKEDENGPAAPATPRSSNFLLGKNLNAIQNKIQLIIK